MKRCALLVAAGRGTRMNKDLPKQFLPLLGEPVLVHTLRHFYRSGIEITLVLNTDFIPYWNEKRSELADVPNHQIVAGGQTRSESVLNGLRSLPTDSLCGIHDAVRPVLDSAFILRLFDAAEKFGNAVPVIPLKDSLRRISDSQNHAVPREEFRIVQTPQVFSTKQLLEAYAKVNYPTFTDEASIFEAAGHRIHLEPGSEINLKITVPGDLLLAAQLIRNSHH